MVRKAQAKKQMKGNDEDVVAEIAAALDSAGAQREAAAPGGMGGKKSVPDRIIKQMEAAAVGGLGAQTIAGLTENEEQTDLEKKYGTSTLGDDVLEQDEEVVSNFDNDSLATIDEDFAAQAKDEPEKEVIELSPAKLTLTFHGRAVNIEVENVSRVTTAQVQRAFQRVYRKLHEARHLERYKDKLNALMNEASAPCPPDRLEDMGVWAAELDKQIVNMQGVIDNIEQSVAKAF